MRHLFGSLRIHQWSKNLLLLVPAFAGQHLSEPGVPWRLGSLFVAFSLCASAGYLLNDLADRDSDRRHPVKRFRPVASGVLGARAAGAAAGLLLAVAFTTAYFEVPAALGVLTVYLLVNITYSTFLKKLVLLDAFVLSGLYLTRLAAGHAVADIPHSPWLFSLAFFLFLSLALSKRASEMVLQRDAGAAANSGRGYRISDLDLVTAIGVCSALASGVVLAIYTQSRHVGLLYAEPVFLLAGVPLLLLWLCRMWLLAHRGEMSEDPVLFALRDRYSYILLLLGIILVFFARTGWVHVAMIE